MIQDLSFHASIVYEFEPNICTVTNVFFASVFRHASSYLALLSETDTIKTLQLRCCRRGWGVIRAVCSAWQALSVFLPTGIDKTRTLGVWYIVQFKSRYPFL